MARSRQHSKQDAYTTNLLISILMRFPEIMSVNLNMPSEQAKFTFVLIGQPGKDKIDIFNNLLVDSLATYEEITEDPFEVDTKIQRTGKLCLLEISCATNSLTLEGIQLITGIVVNAFSGNLMRDAETLEAIHDDEILRQEEIIEYLLNHSTGTKKENLIAFRESGKVFVYDK